MINANFVLKVILKMTVTSALLGLFSVRCVLLLLDTPGCDGFSEIADVSLRVAGETEGFTDMLEETKLEKEAKGDVTGTNTIAQISDKFAYLSRILNEEIIMNYVTKNVYWNEHCDRDCLISFPCSRYCLKNRELAEDVYKDLSHKYSWVDFSVVFYNDVRGFDKHFFAYCKDNAAMKFEVRGKNWAVLYRPRNAYNTGQEKTCVDKYDLADIVEAISKFHRRVWEHKGIEKFDNDPAASLGRMLKHKFDGQWFALSVIKHGHGARAMFEGRRFYAGNHQGWFILIGFHRLIC